MPFNYAVEYTMHMLSLLNNNARAMHYVGELKANYAHFARDETAYDEVLLYGETTGELARLLILAWNECHNRVNSRTYYDCALVTLVASNYLMGLLRETITIVLGLRWYRRTAFTLLPKDVVKLIVKEMWETRKSCVPKKPPFLFSAQAACLSSAST